MIKLAKNRIVLILFVLITIGIFLAYSIKNGIYTVKQIKLEPVNIVVETGGRKKLGITKYVETSNAKYYVNTSANLSDSEIVNYINNSELLFKLAKDDLDMTTSRYEIEFCNKLSSLNYNMKYNPNDKNSEGIIFSSIGNGKLPAWLCIGLERYYKEKYGFQKYDYEKFDMNDWLKNNEKNNLPDFGDYWFVKDFLKEDSKEKACMISHRFVDYLAKEKYLKNIVNCYYVDENDSINLVKEQFNKFLKDANVNITKDVLYTYNNIVITTSKAIYTIENGVETWDTINGDIDFMEKGILYIEETFDREFNKKVDVKIEAKEHPFLDGVTQYGKITLYSGRKGIIHAAVHEMTHAYLFDEGNNVFMHRYSLEEGLCNYISGKYSSININYQRNAVKQVFPNNEQMEFASENYKNKIMNYYKKFNRDNECDFNPWSRASYDAASVYELLDIEFKEGNNTEYFKNYFKNGNYNELECIKSYEASTSFVYYLLEEEISLDDFLLLMDDIDEFNRQNDKTSDQLVNNWVNYLEQAIF